MIKFYITGVSGTGKTTTGEELVKQGIPIIDLDDVKDLCKWIHKDTGERSYWRPGIGKEFFENHEYICDRNQLEGLINQYSDKEAVGVVGLADNLSEIIGLFDKIFIFYCSEETFIKRIEDRQNHDFGKHDSEKEMILTWYKDYKNEMLSKGAIPIDTAKPLSEVVNEVIGHIKSYLLKPI